MDWVLFQTDWADWSSVFAKNFPNQIWPKTPPPPEARQAFLEDTAKLHDLTLLEFVEAIEDFAFQGLPYQPSKSAAA